MVSHVAAQALVPSQFARPAFTRARARTTQARSKKLRVSGVAQRPENWVTKAAKADTAAGKVLRAIGIGTGQFTAAAQKKVSWEDEWQYLRANVRSVDASDAKRLQGMGYVLVDVSPAEHFEAHHPKGAKSAPLYELIPLNASPTDLLKAAVCNLQGVKARRENKNFPALIAEHLRAAGPSCRGVILCCAFGGTTAKSQNFPTGQKSRSLQAAYRTARQLAKEQNMAEVVHLEGGLNAWFEAELPGEGVNESYSFQVGKLWVHQDHTKSSKVSENVAFGMDLLYKKEDRTKVYQAQSTDQNDTPVFFSETYTLAALMAPVLLTGVLLGPTMQLRMMEVMACPPWEEVNGMCVFGEGFDEAAYIPEWLGGAPAEDKDFVNLSPISLEETSSSLRERLEAMQTQQQQQASAFFAREAEKAATETPAAVTSTQSLTERLASIQVQQREQAAEFSSEQAADQARAFAELHRDGRLELGAAALALSSLALTVLLPIRFAMTWFPKVERRRKEMPYAIVTKATDPLLNPLRGIFPRDQTLGGVDPSPIALLIIMSYVDEFALGANGLLLAGVSDPGMQNALQALIVGQRVVFLLAALGMGFRVTGQL